MKRDHIIKLLVASYHYGSTRNLEAEQYIRSDATAMAFLEELKNGIQIPENRPPDASGEMDIPGGGILSRLSGFDH